MLLPVSLGPISRVAKLLETDQDIAVVVLGHADSSGDDAKNRELSQQRARAVTSIFRLSGLKQNRLQVMGLGSTLRVPPTTALLVVPSNRRVEILLTSRDTMQGLIAKYSQRPKAQLKDAPKVAAVDQGNRASRSKLGSISTLLREPPKNQARPIDAGGSWRFPEELP
jgi:hypothetical protein